MFFFPETIKERIHVQRPYLYEQLYDVTDLRSIGDQCDVNNEEFNRRCREYSGFGYLASFIPGTNAFEARKQLSEAVDSYSESLSATLNEIPNIAPDGNVTLFKRWRMATSAKGVITDILLLGPLWRVLDENFNQHFEISRMLFNKKPSIKRLISWYPILKSFYSLNAFKEAKFYPWDEIVSNVFHDLCNPLRLVDDGLLFLHRLLNRMIEIGAEKHQESDFIRGGLKMMTGIVFFIAALPVKAGVRVLDFAFDIVKAVVYKPVKFICLSIYDTCCKQVSDQDEEAGEGKRILNPAHQNLYAWVGAAQPNSEDPQFTVLPTDVDFPSGHDGYGDGHDHHRHEVVNDGHHDGHDHHGDGADIDSHHESGDSPSFCSIL